MGRNRKSSYPLKLSLVLSGFPRSSASNFYKHVTSFHSSVPLLASGLRAPVIVSSGYIGGANRLPNSASDGSPSTAFIRCVLPLGWD